jgi:hypothetical protein
MGWFRNLAEELRRDYNPKTDWWMKGGPAPRTSNQPNQSQPTPVTVVTQEEDVDHEKARMNEERDQRQAATEPTQEAIDHELAVMNEERDQRWAAQDRKAMDIPEPSAGAPWRQAQEMAHEPEAEAPAPSIDPA